MGTVAVQTPSSPASKPDETTLVEIVERSLHPSPSEWLFFRELRVGTGRQNGGAQRLDAFALNTFPHTAMKRVCYEVKTSRGDFLSELKRPLKRRIGMRYSNEFYFVTPAAMVGAAEIKPIAGGERPPEEVAGSAVLLQIAERGGRYFGMGRATNLAEVARQLISAMRAPL